MVMDVEQTRHSNCSRVSGRYAIINSSFSGSRVTQFPTLQLKNMFITDYSD
jgi:hypothetical protein